MNLYKRAVEKFKKNGAAMGGGETVVVEINDEGFSHSPYQVKQLIDEGKHVVVHVQHEYSGGKVTGGVDYTSDTYVITHDYFYSITFSAIVGNGTNADIHSVYGLITENEEYWSWDFSQNFLQYLDD